MVLLLVVVMVNGIICNKVVIIRYGVNKVVIVNGIVCCLNSSYECFVSQYT